MKTFTVNTSSSKGIEMSSHGGRGIEFAREFNIPLDNIIDFSANLNPMAYRLNIADIINRHITTVYHYPDYGGIKTILSNILNIDKECLLLGGGSVALIHIIPRLFYKSSVIITPPTFSEYEHAVLINKGRVLTLALNKDDGFIFPYNKVSAIMKKADILYLCNPNNPTGTLISIDILLELVCNAKKNNVLIIIDEAFIEFTDCPYKTTLIPYINKYDNLVVIRSLTKYFSIPGLRLGYLVGEKGLTKSLSKLLGPWPVSSLAVAVAEELILDYRFHIITKEWISLERDYLYNRLRDISWITPYPTTANFILCEIKKDGTTSRDVSASLLDYAILIRDCSNFTGLNDKFFRVAVKSRQDNHYLIEALQKSFISER